MKTLHYISRVIEPGIENLLFSGKVILITGPRRVGKTTMIKEILKRQEKKSLYLNGEDISTSELLERRSAENYRKLLSDSDILVIDEAQNIQDIGFIAKLIHDEIPGKCVILTGSSSFELVQKAGEPLTGRKITFELLPFSEAELWETHKVTVRFDELRTRLITGSYPEVSTLESKSDRIEYLRELRDAYLLKDILKFENLRNAGKIQNLLRLLALQVGSEVSLQELGKQLSMSKNTVEKYMDLLSKAYVLFKLEGFSRNLRKEITKTSRWYFYDNGIMNIVLNNLDDLSLRRDIGALWENYIISERLKCKWSERSLTRFYFWRTYDQQEIDLIEEEGDTLRGYEMKWRSEKSKVPAAWLKSYPGASYQVIHSGNYHEFVGIRV